MRGYAVVYAELFTGTVQLCGVIRRMRDSGALCRATFRMAHACFWLCTPTSFYTGYSCRPAIGPQFGGVSE